MTSNSIGSSNKKTRPVMRQCWSTPLLQISVEHAHRGTAKKSECWHWHWQF